MNKLYRIKELTALCNKYCDAYYNGQELVSDIEYDSLYQELCDLEQETGFSLVSSPTRNVGYRVHDELPKFKHDIPMLSLDKITTIDEILNFIGSNKAIMSVKEDGLSIRLMYNKNGDLVVAATRGTGIEGSNITENLCAFTNIPTHIETGGKEFIIDGEAICTFENLERLNQNLETPYKHPRAVSSGTVSLLDANEARKRRLNFIAWKFVQGSDSNSYGERLRELSELGFDVVPWCYANNNYIDNCLQMLQDSAHKLSHPYDGIVIALDDVAYGESLGETSKFPKHSKAYKFAQDAEETVINGFEFSLGKSGQLTPVACFDSVVLDGTDVSRCSCHNVSYCKNLRLGIGARVKVIKSMQIIPQIIECVEEGESFTWPSECPVCGGATAIKQDNESEVLICTNLECDGKKIAQFTHFVSRKAMSIDGLSEKTLELLISHGFLHNYKDIYRLKEHKNEITQLPGMGVKSVDKLLDSIEKSRTVTLDRFITALGIPNIGSSAAKAISKQFNGDHYDFVQALANGYDFSQIDDFGEITNKSIHDWWNSKDPMVELLPVEMNFVVENDVSSSSSLNGKSFCITGSLTHYANRDALVKAIEDNGGKYVSGVSKKTDYLINNDTTSTSGKNKKAIELNIPIISEDDFLKMLSE